MPAFLRRCEIARSLDRSLEIETQAVQLRDEKTRLVYTVRADVHATYRVINTKKFIQHYPDLPAFEADFSSRLKRSGSAALVEALADADRSRLARKSDEIGKRVTQALSAFLANSGVLCLSCSCTPVVVESAALEEIESLRAIREIDPGLAAGKVWGQVGAGWTSGMHPVGNAYLGRMVPPALPRDTRKDPLL